MSVPEFRSLLEIYENGCTKCGNQAELIPHSGYDEVITCPQCHWVLARLGQEWSMTFPEGFAVTSRDEEAYTCSECGEEFLKVRDNEWSDESAEAEWRAAFPGYPDSCKAIVCDDCYNKIMSNAARAIA